VFSRIPSAPKLNPKSTKIIPPSHPRIRGIGLWLKPFEAGAGCSHTADREREIAVIQQFY